MSEPCSRSLVMHLPVILLPFCWSQTELQLLLLLSRLEFKEQKRKCGEESRRLECLQGDDLLLGPSLSSPPNFLHSVPLFQIQGARKEIPMEVNVMEATCHCQVSTAVSCTESKILLIDWLIILEVCRDPEPGMAGATPNASEVVSWRQISKRIWLFSHWCEWDTPSLLASWLTFGKQLSGLAMQLPYIPPATSVLWFLLKDRHHCRTSIKYTTNI